MPVSLDYSKDEKKGGGGRKNKNETKIIHVADLHQEKTEEVSALKSLTKGDVEI